MIETKDIRDEIIIVKIRIHLNLKNTDLIWECFKRERETPMSEENYIITGFKKKSNDAKEMMIRMVGTIFYDLILVEN